MSDETNDPRGEQRPGNNAQPGGPPMSRIEADTAATLQALATARNTAEQLGLDVNAAVSCAIATICSNLAQSTGIAWQNSVLNQQQQFIASQATAIKGAIEIFRSHPSTPRGQPPASVSPAQVRRSEIQELIQAVLREESRANGPKDNA